MCEVRGTPNTQTVTHARREKDNIDHTRSVWESVKGHCLWLEGHCLWPKGQRQKVKGQRQCTRTHTHTHTECAMVWEWVGK